MWTWVQSDGSLRLNGKVAARGYSGKGRGLNNPALQGMRGIGPIPTGRYRAVRVYDSPKVGRFTIELRAVDATPNDDVHDATGRGALRWHGDNPKANYSASEGCIISPYAARAKFWASSDHFIDVVATPQDIPFSEITHGHV